MKTTSVKLSNLGNYVFGSTSAIITNTCLIVGLGSGKTARLALLGALLTIALADNISDSLGIHMVKEAEGHGTPYSFITMAMNFFARLLISSSFIALVLLFPMPLAATIAVGWSLFLLVAISYLIARNNHTNPWLEIGKHVLVAILVIVASRYAGSLIAEHF